nr:MAG TPA: hypothetical protein [Caudoviricetes sp.]
MCRRCSRFDRGRYRLEAARVRRRQGAAERAAAGGARGVHPSAAAVLFRGIHIHPRRRDALLPAVLPAAESDHRLDRRREARDAERKAEASARRGRSDLEAGGAGDVFSAEEAEAKKAQEIKSAPTTIPPALRATSLCTREALGDGGSARNKNRRTS